MWLSKREYEQLTQRAECAEQALELERHENRLAERHWANALLRANRQYPKVERDQPDMRAASIRMPVIDEGELAALTMEANRLGIDPEVAKQTLYAEKGLTWPPLK